MSALLNGDPNGFFYAYVKRQSGEDLIFEVDPEQGEQILLQRGGRLDGQKVPTVAQFPQASDLGDSEPAADWERNPLKIEAYRIDATVAKGLDCSATATLRFSPRRPNTRWARFVLFGELDVDSVVDATGVADSFHRAKNGSDLWVRFSTAPQVGQSDSVRVVYHGDLLAFPDHPRRVSALDGCRLASHPPCCKRPRFPATAIS